MKTLSTTRTALAVGAASLAILIPTATANAADGPAADTAAVTRLANDAARLLAEERDLVELARSGGPDSRAWDQLAVVDAHGRDALATFDTAGIDLAPSIRSALDELDLGDGDVTAPQPAVYAAAIDGLGRIAATPDAVLGTDRPSGSATQHLLIVAGVALLILVVTARTAAERRSATDWHDVLTGVANRRRLDRDLALGGDPDLGPTAAIVVDVDRLDAVNTTFGAETGDGVLRALGEILSTTVRQQDVVYRSGGGEFCVLLVGATTGDALAIADRVVDATHAIGLPDGSNATVSVGVAVGPPEAIGHTIADAGHAMVDAKIGGRDRVHTAAHLEPV